MGLALLRIQVGETLASLPLHRNGFSEHGPLSKLLSVAKGLFSFRFFRILSMIS